MGEPGYAVLRAETVAWLLECYRAAEEAKRPPLTADVALDLREVAAAVQAPVPEDRLRMTGPILSLAQHQGMLVKELDLPAEGPNAEFWKLVSRVVHCVLVNEGEAAIRVLGLESEE